MPDKGVIAKLNYLKTNVFSERRYVLVLGIRLIASTVSKGGGHSLPGNIA